MRTTAELVRELESTRDATLGFFALSSAELSCTYGPGKWSVRYLLHHLADSETVLYERIRRVVCEPPQTLLVFDQDAWAVGLDYARMPLHLSRGVFESVRNAVIYLAGQYYEPRGHLTFVHSTMGRRTLREELDKVADHNAHHLGHIRAALARG
jgi:DinB superfamily